MIDWMILAAVKVVKLAVLGLVALSTSIAPCCTDPASEQAVLAPPAPEGIPVVVSIEVPEIEAPVAVVAIEVKRLAPPVRIETILSPDLLVPPKVRDLNF